MDDVLTSPLQSIFNSYPEFAREKLLEIRAAIFEVAEEESLGEISENLKWGEPNYRLENLRLGSSIRMDWKSRSTDTISVYFNCKTILIETFKEIYGDTFTYVGNREIVCQLSEALPTRELKDCISMALRYHQIKHLPLLGA